MSHLHIARHQSRRDWKTNATVIRKTTLTGKVTHVSTLRGIWTTVVLSGMLMVPIGTTKWFEKSESKFPEGWEDQKD